MGFGTRVRADLLWAKNNAESVVAVVLAVTMSVLGIVDVIPADLVGKVIPLTLGVVAFAMLRDRWRQELLNEKVEQTITDIADTLHQLHERLDRTATIDGLLTSTQRTLDGLTAIRFAVGSELSDALAQARSGTDRWIFKGGTGAHTRVVTLPDCVQQALHNRRELLVRMEILDPMNMEVCERYAALYRSLAEGSNDDALTWTGKGTQIELFATILSACWYKQRLPHLLDIEIGLTSKVSMFRWDLSSRYLIVTQRGPRFPAMIIERGRPYYDSWSIELRTSFGETRRIPIDRALRVELAEQPRAEEVRGLFDALELSLPADYDDADVADIVTKALRDSGRPLRGAGDQLGVG
ncbi:hypothetical protein ACQP0C_27190 [Nocardia sp. CA-129566]|uniref:hypothetical protein n=1 Tax=Nocardia sp. CA-129566 TaxID=3239976 RepID=UPI003D97AB51